MEPVQKRKKCFWGLTKYGNCKRKTKNSVRDFNSCKYGLTRSNNCRRKPCRNGMNSIGKCMRKARSTRIPKPIEAAPQRKAPSISSSSSSSRSSPSYLKVASPPKAELIKSAAAKWAKMYKKKYEPPVWSLECVADDDWMSRARKVRVYAPEGVNPADLAVVVSEREPVNIEMHKEYSPQGESGYSRLYRETNKLGPNFGLYMLARISSTAGNLVTPVECHVMNSIGFAFDDVMQPDYKYWMQNFTEEKKRGLTAALAKALQFVFQCAKDLDLRKICLCYLGGVSFAQLFKPYKEAYLDLYLDALQMAALPYLDSLDEINILGYNNFDPLMKRVGKGVKAVVEGEFKKTCRLLGLIPQILTSDMLFMNAWDPNSVVGNGNWMDNSLDGFFGRLSDMGYMSIPDVNPFILNNVVYV